EEAARRREQRVLRAAEKRRAAVYRRAQRRAKKKQAKTQLVARRASAAKRKSKGGGVTALQSKLGLTSDGTFGARTERALKRWQKRNGLTPDGMVGPETREELGLGRGKVLKRKGAGRRPSTRRPSTRRRSSGGNTSGVVGRVIAAANRIATKPYRYGGGHASFEDTGYDCSGSVSYALRGGGLIDAPLNSSGFMSYGAAGPGKHITIYANPGHMYMVVNGRRFDTNLGEDGSRWDSQRRSTSGYTVRHPPGY
ncbi:MAG: peptidoglycan-binding protein, partial [Thermoleophilaceae bacterium]|nr:peptidoglycan-binding protein [Thermoleophilaceae bacterium]